MAATAYPPASLAADLEAIRLRHRLVRLRRVVDALEERAGRYDGAVPPGLRESLAGFREELSEVEQRLARR